MWRFEKENFKFGEFLGCKMNEVHLHTKSRDFVVLKDEPHPHTEV
jgi:hypothetical protein